MGVTLGWAGRSWGGGRPGEGEEQCCGVLAACGSAAADGDSAAGVQRRVYHASAEGGCDLTTRVWAQVPEPAASCVRLWPPTHAVAASVPLAAGALRYPRSSRYCSTPQHSGWRTGERRRWCAGRAPRTRQQHHHQRAGWGGVRNTRLPTERAATGAQAGSTSTDPSEGAGAGTAGQRQQQQSVGHVPPQPPAPPTCMMVAAMSSALCMLPAASRASTTISALSGSSSVRVRGQGAQTGSVDAGREGGVRWGGAREANRAGTSVGGRGGDARSQAGRAPDRRCHAGPTHKGRRCR